MVDFLFYGTLIDPDVLRLVVGRELPRQARQLAVLSDYRRRAVRDQVFPAVVPAAGAETEGILVVGLSLKEAARVSCFEDEDYEVRLCAVVPLDATRAPLAARQAWVYVATSSLSLTNRTWSYARWRQYDKPRYVVAVRDWLDRRGYGTGLLAQEAAWRRRLSAENRESAVNR